MASNVHLPSSTSRPSAVLVKTLVRDQTPCILSMLSPCQIIRPFRTITSSWTPLLPTVLSSNDTASCSFAGCTPCDSGEAISHALPGKALGRAAPTSNFRLVL